MTEVVLGLVVILAFSALVGWVFLTDAGLRFRHHLFGHTAVWDGQWTARCADCGAVWIVDDPLADHHS